MARLHLIIGPVGAGKSTFALELCRQHRAVRFTLDEWMAVLFGADERPREGRMQWYVERTERCLEQIWRTTENVLAAGVDAVLEVGLIRRAARQAFYGRVDAGAYDLTVYVLDADRDVRRERVLRRNRERGATFAMDVPLDIFELASDLWEPPGADECEEREIRFV